MKKINTPYLRPLLNVNKKEILDYLLKCDCGNMILSATSFFQFITLFKYAVRGYSIKNILDILRPKVIVSNDDCMHTKPINKYQNYKFIVLQSASIPESYEKCRNFIFDDLNLLPDYFLCTGQKFREIKRKYKTAKNVVVTGQPRYDILHHADKIYSKEKFLKKYKINSNHKIILWITQCHALSDEENIKNFKAVFETMENLKNATLIIKQHPAEGGEYTKMIKEYLSNYKISVVLTPKNSDTYEQLFACDLMITRHSTTAMEAIALNKPVIILNLSGEPDPVNYVEEGVALGVYKDEDLKLTIKKLLRDNSMLAKNRERYIEKYLYKIDGKATERVVNLIEEMTEESQRRKNEK